MNIGTSGLQAWIEDNVIQLILLVLAVIVLWAAKGGNISKGVTVIGGALLGLMFLGMTDRGQEIGDWLSGLVTG